MAVGESGGPLASVALLSNQLAREHRRKRRELAEGLRQAAQLVFVQRHQKTSTIRIDCC